jgi:hypothetical protein
VTCSDWKLGIKMSSRGRGNPVKLRLFFSEVLSKFHSWLVRSMLLRVRAHAPKIPRPNFNLVPPSIFSTLHAPCTCTPVTTTVRGTERAYWTVVTYSHKPFHCAFFTHPYTLLLKANSKAAHQSSLSLIIFRIIQTYLLEFSRACPFTSWGGLFAID